MGFLSTASGVAGSSSSIDVIWTLSVSGFLGLHSPQHDKDSLIPPSSASLMEEGLCPGQPGSHATSWTPDVQTQGQMTGAVVRKPQLSTEGVDHEPDPDSPSIHLAHFISSWVPGVSLSYRGGKSPA